VSELSAFDYAVLRVVPHVEREEFLNVGVILFCRPRAFLGVRIRLDAPRLLALAPQIDMGLGRMSQSERFHWLTTPRSTTIQISPMHGGLCDDPQAALDDLFVRLVA
jgi:hypothetical protein